MLTNIFGEHLYCFIFCYYFPLKYNNLKNFQKRLEIFTNIWYNSNIPNFTNRKGCKNGKVKSVDSGG